MDGLPALKMWQAPDIGNIMRNIATIKGQRLRSRLADIGEAREERQEVRDIERLNLQKGTATRAKKKATREEDKAEREKELENLKTVTGVSQFVLKSAQQTPQTAQKAHDIGIKTLQEIGGDTSDIPEEWGPEAQQYWQQAAQLGRNVLAYHMKGGLKEPATKRVWDKETEEYVQRSQAAINKDPDRYGQTKEQAVELRKAGAPKVEVLTGRAVAKKRALTKLEVEEGPKFIADSAKEFKATIEDWDLMEPEKQEKQLMGYVQTKISGLYENTEFRRNKKTGEIRLYVIDKGKKEWRMLREWPKQNF